MTAALVIAGTVSTLMGVANHFRESHKTGILEIRDTFSGNLYGRWPLKNNDEFAIEFIHSVNQSPVRETFQIDDGKFRLQSVRLYSFSAGMQSDMDENQTMVWDGDAMVISGFNASFKELNLIAGAVSNHVLFINNKTVNLQKLLGQCAETVERNVHITIRYR